jgi:ABC-type iron transport system FetAB ATPase subunit
MIFLIIIVSLLVGAVAGASLARRYIVNLSPTAQERAEHAQAVALARDLLMTPDALLLRDRAKKIVDRADARAANRKDS